MSDEPTPPLAARDPWDKYMRCRSIARPMTPPNLAPDAVEAAREAYAIALDEAGGAGAAFIRSGHGNSWVDPAIAAIARALTAAPVATPPAVAGDVVEARREALIDMLVAGIEAWKRNNDTAMDAAIDAALAALSTQPATVPACDPEPVLYSSAPADDLEAEGRAPWQQDQPIEEKARYWKGAPWVPLDAAISELQFWQRRDFEHGNASATVSAGDPEPGADAVAALIAWARSQQAFPVGHVGGEGWGHIDENARFKLRDLVDAIDAAAIRQAPEAK